jgi:nucleotide-binding universal stress UspA family protein
MADAPALLCFDGSDGARRAIERAGALLGGGPALVLTVWESIGSAVLRHRAPLPGQIGRETRAIAEDVIEELDASTATAAEATAAQGAEIAAAAGFDARPEARRAIARAAEHGETTVWHAILEYADEQDARVVVLGSRGLSGVRAAFLGSVSYGVVHHSSRPLLVVPPE